jgi:hypothetical protein
VLDKYLLGTVCCGHGCCVVCCCPSPSPTVNIYNTSACNLQLRLATSCANSARGHSLAGARSPEWCYPPEPQGSAGGLAAVAISVGPRGAGMVLRHTTYVVNSMQGSTKTCACDDSFEHARVHVIAGAALLRVVDFPASAGCRRHYVARPGPLCSLFVALRTTRPTLRAVGKVAERRRFGRACGIPFWRHSRAHARETV